jgi:L-fuculose-phosphate aldolase
MAMTPHEQICEFGRRLDARGFAAANDGNLSMRLADGSFLCTPTMQSKGTMQPDDLCVVDADGRQLSGTKKRSSEILLHLEVYRHRPDVQAVVHCHPPHATAFAIAGEPVPQCVLPEVEIFLGEVPTAPYATPGSRAFAESIVPFVRDSSVIVLANHGTVSFGPTMELAFWFTDILDAYCRTLILARQLGRINRFGEERCRELLEYKLQWGFTDLRIYGPRANCNVCGHEAWRSSWPESGLEQRAFPDIRPAAATVPAADRDRVGTLTGEELSRLANLIAERLLAAGRDVEKLR